MNPCECVQDAGQCSRSFACMSWWPPGQTGKGDTIITAILQVQTLRHKEDKPDHRGWKTGFWRGDSAALTGIGMAPARIPRRWGREELEDEEGRTLRNTSLW